MRACTYLYTCAAMHHGILGGGGGVRGTHHALQLDVINVLTCGQKEELRACTYLYTCAAMHHGILGGGVPLTHRGGGEGGEGGDL